MKFTIQTDRLSFSTDGHGDMLDITEEIAAVISERGFHEGSLLLFVPGATAALTTIEYEPGLQVDFPAFFDRIIPEDIRYHHNDTWHDGNGHSHVRASLLGPSLTVPVAGGALQLGTWQQILLVDFDNRSRDRELIAQLQGFFQN